MKKFLKSIAILAVTALVFTSCGKKGDEPTPATPTPPVVVPPIQSTPHIYNGVGTTTYGHIYIFSDGTAFSDVDKTTAVDVYTTSPSAPTPGTKLNSSQITDVYNGDTSPIYDKDGYVYTYNK